jgi:hypothetical protein
METSGWGGVGYGGVGFSSISYGLDQGFMSHLHMHHVHEACALCTWCIYITCIAHLAHVLHHAHGAAPCTWCLCVCVSLTCSICFTLRIYILPWAVLWSFLEVREYVI